MDVPQICTHSPVQVVAAAQQKQDDAAGGCPASCFASSAHVACFMSELTGAQGWYLSWQLDLGSQDPASCQRWAPVAATRELARWALYNGWDTVGSPGHWQAGRQARAAHAPAHSVGPTRASGLGPRVHGEGFVREPRASGKPVIDDELSQAMQMVLEPVLHFQAQWCQGLGWCALPQHECCAQGARAARQAGQGRPA